MKKILMVDDIIGKDSPFGKDLIKAGKKINASLDFIETTEKAIELLRTANYDLVLMDGNFNNCDLQGPEATAEIRKFSNIPIVMISGNLEDNKRGVTRGADAYLDKDEVIKDIGCKNGKIKKSFSLDQNREIAKLSGRPTELIDYIVRIFLPLDIDIQTLEILCKEKGDTEKFLKEVYSDEIDYSRHLADLRFISSGEEAYALDASEKAKELLNNSIPLAERNGIDKSRLYQLCGIPNNQVTLFFLKLKKKTTDAKTLIGHNWKIQGVKSFHDWYCDLANILREGVN